MSKCKAKIFNWGHYNSTIHIFHNSYENLYKGYINFGKRMQSCIAAGKTINDIIAQLEQGINPNTYIKYRNQ